MSDGEQYLGSQTNGRDRARAAPSPADANQYIGNPKNQRNRASRARSNPDGDQYLGSQANQPRKASTRTGRGVGQAADVYLGNPANQPSQAPQVPNSYYYGNQFGNLGNPANQRTQSVPPGFGKGPTSQQTVNQGAAQAAQAYAPAQAYAQPVTQAQPPPPQATRAAQRLGLGANPTGQRQPVSDGRMPTPAGHPSAAAMDGAFAAAYGSEGPTAFGPTVPPPAFGEESPMPGREHEYGTGAQFAEGYGGPMNTPPPIDADRQGRSPGLAKNFYDVANTDFRRPWGARGGPAPPSMEQVARMNDDPQYHQQQQQVQAQAQAQQQAQQQQAQQQQQQQQPQYQPQPQPQPQLQVAIPDGITPGQLFTVVTPEGQEMQVQCPADAAPGQTIAIMVPAAEPAPMPVATAQAYAPQPQQQPQPPPVQAGQPMQPMQPAIQQPVPIAQLPVVQVPAAQAVQPMQSAQASGAGYGQSDQSSVADMSEDRRGRRRGRAHGRTGPRMSPIPPTTTAGKYTGRPRGPAGGGVRPHSQKGQPDPLRAGLGPYTGRAGPAGGGTRPRRQMHQPDPLYFGRGPYQGRGGPSMRPRHQMYQPDPLMHGTATGAYTGRSGPAGGSLRPHWEKFNTVDPLDQMRVAGAYDGRSAGPAGRKVVHPIEFFGPENVVRRPDGGYLLPPPMDGPLGGPMMEDPMWGPPF